MRPPQRKKPLFARLLSPPGAPDSRLFESAGASVMAVPGRYSVSYLLLAKEAIAVVDCGSADDVERIVEALDWLERSRDEVRWVIPTHLHFDHMMGVNALALALDAEVAMSPTARVHVSEGRALSWPRRRHLWHAVVTWPMQGLPFFPMEDWRGGMDFGFPWAKNRFSARLGPALYDGEPLHGFEGWTVLETPGHSDCGLSLYHEDAGWLVAGDTLRNFLGGEWNQLLADPEAYRQTRHRLGELDVKLVFPGHGPAFVPPHGLAELKPLPWYMP